MQVLRIYTGADKSDTLPGGANQMEIETGLREKRLLGTGDVLVAEDLTGKGHITRSVGAVQRVTLSVPLASA